MHLDYTEQAALALMLMLTLRRFESFIRHSRKEHLARHGGSPPRFEKIRRRRQRGRQQ
jgi:hypothetical protein